MRITYILLIINICLSQDSNEGYRLINKYHLNESIIASFGTSSDFEIKNTNISTNFSSIVKTKMIKQDNQNTTFHVTYDNVVALNKFGEKTKPIREMSKLKDEVFTITVDKRGKVIDRSGLTEWGSDWINSGGGEVAGNYLFPFGSDSLRKPGDSWVEKTETDFSSMPGFKNAEGRSKLEITYFFKKVKKKRNNMIAYIDYTGEIAMDGYFSVMGIDLKGTNIGKRKGKVTFDITNGKILKIKTEDNSTSTMVALGSGKEMKFYQTMTTSYKNKD